MEILTVENILIDMPNYLAQRDAIFPYPLKYIYKQTSISFKVLFLF